MGNENNLKITSVTYGEESSVRIADFQYVKPRVEMSAAVQEGQTEKEVFEVLAGTVRSRLKSMEANIRATYKPDSKKSK